jgi:hypothetical protein
MVSFILWGAIWFGLFFLDYIIDVDLSPGTPIIIIFSIVTIILSFLVSLDPNTFDCFNHYKSIQGNPDQGYTEQMTTRILYSQNIQYFPKKERTACGKYFYYPIKQNIFKWYYIVPILIIIVEIVYQETRRVRIKELNFVGTYVCNNSTCSTKKEKYVSSYSAPDIDMNSIQSAISIIQGTISVLFPLYFMGLIQKYKESRKLYQSVCGDIKALTIYTVSLTNDFIKYNLREKNRRLVFLNQTSKTPEESRISENGLNVDVEFLFACIRYILAALPQTIKWVVREKVGGGDIKADIDKITYGHFLKQEVHRRKWYNACCKQTVTFESCNYTWKNDTNIIGQELYSQLKDISTRTNMDLVECLMMMLLRYIDELKTVERLVVIGPNNIQQKQKLLSESLERDFITKWNHIYGSYGPMVTNQTYKPPGTVNFLFYGILVVYALLMPWGYISADETGRFVAILNICIFSIMLSVGRVVSNPFVNVFINPTISEDARETQEHVVRLINAHAVLDQRAIHGYKETKEDIMKTYFDEKVNNVIRPDCKISYDPPDCKISPDPNEKKKDKIRKTTARLFQTGNERLKFY